MAKICQVLVATIILHACANAASIDKTKLKEITRNEQDLKLNDEPDSPTEDEYDTHSTLEGHLQTQFYRNGFPPMNPIIYPSYVDGTSNNDNFENDDPFVQIYKQLQDIATVIRRSKFSTSLPSSGFLPIYFPVIYIPQFGCGCNSNRDLPTDTQNASVPTKPKNDTLPNIEKRILEDANQNWGLVNDGEQRAITTSSSVNPANPSEPATKPRIESPTDTEKDFTRPVSFEPIPPKRPLKRPLPPVEHGSFQAGIK